jgi:hypothetical protein
MRTAGHENSGHSASTGPPVSFTNMCCASHAQQEAQQHIRVWGPGWLRA